MAVATSLIWFCWAGTMESEEGGGGKYITIHGDREKEAGEEKVAAASLTGV